MTIRIVALPTEEVAALQRGGPDAHGQMPERRIADGDGLPCRHCLTDIKPGEPYLILAYRPFHADQPFAETGPIFLHAEPCRRFEDGDGPPGVLAGRENFIIRGYDGSDRIAYGVGGMVPAAELRERAASLLAEDRVAYVHVRSAKYTCYQFRIERG